MDENKLDSVKMSIITNEKLPSTSNVDKALTDTILENARKTNIVKDVIDLAATKKAIEQQGTVDKLVNEKTRELTNDAEAKRIKSETDKIREEVEKVKQEEEKKISELRKIKSTLEGEVANLKALDDKAQAYFDANKSILKCIGVREKLSLKSMQWLMIPAGVIFTIFQVLLLPFSLIGFAIEQLMNIIGAVCGKIASNGWKMALSIIVSIVVVGMIGLVYYAVTHWLVGVF